MTEKYEQWHFVDVDENFVAELGETLDQYNLEDYSHLVMDVWEDAEYGTLWEIRPDDQKLSYDIPEEEITRFHRFADCQEHYSPRDEVLCYFVLSMNDYARGKEAENGRACNPNL